MGVELPGQPGILTEVQTWSTFPLELRRELKEGLSLLLSEAAIGQTYTAYMSAKHSSDNLSQEVFRFLFFFFDATSWCFVKDSSFELMVC